MIKVENGDLLKAAEDIIGHQVNCRGVMGSGIAKGIRSNFPEAYEAYMMTYNSVASRKLLGQCQIVSTSKGKLIANLFGQFNYGRSSQRYTDYDALRQSLNDLKLHAKRYGHSVALPYNIGCGLANGEWDVVESIIQEVFSDYDVTLYKLS